MTVFKNDDESVRCLTVLANATAEVVGRGKIYKSILKVATVTTESNFRAACELFDDQPGEERSRIRDHAVQSLWDELSKVVSDSEDMPTKSADVPSLGKAWGDPDEGQTGKSDIIGWKE